MSDHYLDFTVTDFISDKNFISWVLDPDDEFDQEWTAWILKHPQKKKIIDDAKAFVRNIRFEEEDVQRSKDKVWQSLEKDISSTETETSIQTIRYPLLRFAVAAAFALLLVFTFLMNKQTSISTKPGESIQVSLPDKSIIHLNDLSTIDYDEDKFSNDRLVYLDGEAFFDVTPGSTFIVKTDQGEVEVLGTTFNVFARDEKFRIHCKSGRVKVKSTDDEIILNAGEKTQLIDGLSFETRVSDISPVNWLEGVYRYIDSPLADVIKELERQFDLEIRIPSELEKIRYTGFFKDDDLSSALESVFWPLSLKAEVNGRTIDVHR